MDWRIVFPATIAITLFCTATPDDSARAHPATLFSVPLAQNLSDPTLPTLPTLTPIALPHRPVEKTISRDARAAAYGQLPLAFERNMGQTDERVQFLSRGNGYTFFLTGDAAVLALHKSAPRTGARSAVAVRLEYVGANTNTVIRRRSRCRR